VGIGLGDVAGHVARTLLDAAPHLTDRPVAISPTGCYLCYLR
jgi:hypothetical protein